MARAIPAPNVMMTPPAADDVGAYLGRELMFKLRSLKPAMSAAACAGVLVLAGTGIAAAATAGGQGGSGDSGQHAAAAATCTRLWAVVNKDGVLQRAGCTGIKSNILGAPGHYQVLFPRNVRNCAYVATIGNAGSANAVNHPGFAGVVGRTGNTNGVFVETFAPGGTDSSAGFHLIVECK